MIVKKIFNKLFPYRESLAHYQALRREIQEVIKANVFHDSITDLAWVKRKNFSPHGAAANYSFLYLLVAVLSTIKPKMILESGIGQSSKLTTQYVTYGNTESVLTLIENNQFWLNVFRAELALCERVKFLLCDQVQIQYKNDISYGYKDLVGSLVDHKFGLIINDGPDGSTHYSRIWILDLLQNHLADKFVIILDDCDRLGEREMAYEVMSKLTELGIKHEYTIFKGIKHQFVIYSPEYNFLKTL